MLLKIITKFLESVDQESGKGNLKMIFSSVLQCLRVSAGKVQSLGLGVEWHALGEEIIWSHFHSFIWLLTTSVSLDLSLNYGPEYLHQGFSMLAWASSKHGCLHFLTWWLMAPEAKWQNQHKAAWLFLL